MKVYEKDGYVLSIDTVGVTEVHATITDDVGGVYEYDNPISAKADFLALTGVEV